MLSRTIVRHFSGPSQAFLQRPLKKLLGYVEANKLEMARQHVSKETFRVQGKTMFQMFTDRCKEGREGCREVATALQLMYTHQNQPETTLPALTLRTARPLLEEMVQQQAFAAVATVMPLVECSARDLAQMARGVVDGAARARAYDAVVDVYGILVARESVPLHPVLISRTTQALCRLGRVQEARSVVSRVFDQKRGRLDASCFNSIISAFARQEDLEGAKEVFAQMETMGVELTGRTFNCLVDACARVGDAAAAGETLRAMVERGFSPDLITINCMIKAYSAAGKVTDAFEMLQRLELARLSPTLVTYTPLLEACAMAKDTAKAQEVFADLQQRGLVPDLTAYNTFLNAFGKVGNMEECRRICDEMRSQGIIADEITYNILAQGWLTARDLEGLWVSEGEREAMGLPRTSVTHAIIATNLIHLNAFPDLIAYLQDLASDEFARAAAPITANTAVGVIKLLTGKPVEQHAQVARVVHLLVKCEAEVPLPMALALKTVVVREGANQSPELRQAVSEMFTRLIGSFLSQSRPRRRKGRASKA